LFRTTYHDVRTDVEYSLLTLFKFSCFYHIKKVCAPFLPEISAFYSVQAMNFLSFALANYHLILSHCDVRVCNWSAPSIQVEFPVNYSEQSVPLSSDELSQLRSEFRLSTILSFLILPILLGAAGFFFYMGSDFWPFRVFSPIFALMAIAIVGTNYYKQNKDLQKSTKTIITGIIDDKNEKHSTSSSSSGVGSPTSSTHSYYFVLSGHEIAVSSLQYSKFHQNDAIIIERLPFTGKILSMRLAETQAGINAERPSLQDAPNISRPGYSDSSYPMSESEEQLLKRAKRRFIIRSFRWVSVPLWCYLALRIFIMDGTIWQEIQHSRFTLTQFIVILPMIVQALRLPNRILPYNLDLTSGMKTTRRTVITDKRHGVNNGSKFWCISFNNEEYDIPQAFYEAVDIGEEVQFHFAEHSNVKFSINSTKSSSVSVNF